MWPNNSQVLQIIEQKKNLMIKYYNIKQDFLIEIWFNNRQVL
jgi:hypothetical protein